MASPERSSSAGSALTAHETTEADLDIKHRTGTGAVAEARPATGVAAPADVEKAAGLAEKARTLTDDDFDDDEKDPYADVPDDQRGTAGLRRPWCALGELSSRRPQCARADRATTP
jgi:hypothetical protein